MAFPRIVVRIDSWETGSLYPNGHFVKSLGPNGNVDTETAVILTENAIKVGPFSEKQAQKNSERGVFFTLSLNPIDR